MTTAGFLLTLARLGVQLEAADDDLRYRARAGVVTQDIKAEITKQKLALLEVLADPRRTAREAWKDAVEEISKLWESSKLKLGEAPWLEEQQDAELQGKVADAIRAGDLPRALEAVDRWRAAWGALLNPTKPTTSGYPGKAGGASTPPGSPPSPGNPTNPTSGQEPGDEGDQAACDPDFERQGTPSKNPTNPTRDKRVFPGPSPEVARLDPGHMRWLERKIARASGLELFGWLEEPGRSEEERDIFRSELLSRADALIEEFEERIPHPNQSVWDMFDEARGRLVSRDIEERSITAWLRRHAPAVAACWPEASVDAAWIDWRQHVGPDDVGRLDEAIGHCLRGVLAADEAASDNKSEGRREQL